VFLFIRDLKFFQLVQFFVWNVENRESSDDPEYDGHEMFSVEYGLVDVVQDVPQSAPDKHDGEDVKEVVGKVRRKISFFMRASYQWSHILAIAYRERAQRGSEEVVYFYINVGSFFGCAVPFPASSRS